MNKSYKVPILRHLRVCLEVLNSATLTIKKMINSFTTSSSDIPAPLLCPNLSPPLSLLPPIKPPSDLPTTFTFKPYPSRASTPLLLHAHTFFSLPVIPNYITIFITPSFLLPQTLISFLGNTVLQSSSCRQYITIHLNLRFLITCSFIYLYVQRHI